MIRSFELQPGTKLRHRPTGAVVTLDCRKDPESHKNRSDMVFHPGWWLTGSDGGLADFVIDTEESEWELVTAETVVTWDYKEQPDWDSIQDAIRRVFDGSRCPGICEVPNTQGDQYAVVISSRPYTGSEAQAVWDNWDWESNVAGGDTHHAD